MKYPKIYESSLDVTDKWTVLFDDGYACTMSYYADRSNGMCMSCDPVVLETDREIDPHTAPEGVLRQIERIMKQSA